MAQETGEEDSSGSSTVRLLVASNKPSNLLCTATHTHAHAHVHARVHTHMHMHTQQFSAVVFLPQAGGELFCSIGG